MSGGTFERFVTILRLFGQGLIEGENGLTEMKVPGKKNKVTKVITFIETVSVFVLTAMLFMSAAIFSILNVEALE